MLFCHYNTEKEIFLFLVTQKFTQFFIKNFVFIIANHFDRLFSGCFISLNWYTMLHIIKLKKLKLNFHQLFIANKNILINCTRARVYTAAYNTILNEKFNKHFNFDIVHTHMHFSIVLVGGKYGYCNKYNFIPSTQV